MTQNWPRVKATLVLTAITFQIRIFWQCNLYNVWYKIKYTIMTTSGESGSASSVQALKEVSKQHEVNLVIEFGIDRIATWLGVYLIAALGAFVKIAELFGKSTAC